MHIVERHLEAILLNKLTAGRVLALTGPAGVGKTRLLKSIKDKYGDKCVYLNAAREPEKHRLQSLRIVQAIHSPSILMIDEAFRISDLDTIVKRIREVSPYTRFIFVFGSASQCGDFNDLDGIYNLYPLTEQEYRHFHNNRKKHDILPERLVYGNYPRLLHLKTRAGKQEYLLKLTDQYRTDYLDVLKLKTQKGKDLQLMRMLSFLVGQEIFYRELEQKLSLTRKTIEKFIDKLLQMNLVIRLEGFKRNLKKEVGKHGALYFTDNGIRNAIINNFNPVRVRDDVDKLWKNYLISERLKHQHYKQMETRNYFWRTYDQQELDWVEEYPDRLVGYRFTLESSFPRAPHAWRRAYGDAEFRVINPDNYRQWIMC